MTKFVLTSTLGTLLVLSMCATRNASAGIFDIFHHNDDCWCQSCPQCGYCCEEKKEKHHHCCLCPAEPPVAGVAYSFPFQFDPNQPIATEKEPEPKPQAGERDMETRMKKLETDLTRLTIDVKALADAVKKIKSTSIDK